jgi:hypothetical protein
MLMFYMLLFDPGSTAFLGHERLFCQLKEANHASHRTQSKSRQLHTAPAAANLVMNGMSSCNSSSVSHVSTLFLQPQCNLFRINLPIHYAHNDLDTRLKPKK